LQVFDYLAVDFPIKIQKIKSVSNNYNSFLLHFLLILGKKKTYYSIVVINRSKISIDNI